MFQIGDGLSLFSEINFSERSQAARLDKALPKGIICYNLPIIGELHDISRLCIWPVVQANSIYGILAEVEVPIMDMCKTGRMLMSKTKVEDFFYGAVLSMLFNNHINPALVEGDDDRRYMI